MNPTVYNTDIRQIRLALAYMTKGTASTWAQTFYQDAFTFSPPKFRKWDDFEKAFEEAFLSPDQAGEALTKLRELKQGMVHSSSMFPCLKPWSARHLSRKASSL